MAVRNESATIRACLDALLAQDYPGDRYEIIVADGQSTDDTAAIIRAVAASSRTPIILLPNPAMAVGPGLNAALRISQGDFIVRMDGHTIASADYIRSCILAFSDDRIGVVGGAMLPVSDKPWGWAIGAAMRSRIGVGDARFHLGGQPSAVDTVYLGAFRRSVLERSGLYDEAMTLNEDYELNTRIRAQGYKIFFHPSIKSAYHPRSSLKALAKQYFGYGWWRVRTIRKHRWSIRWRQVLPPSFVGAVFLLAVATVYPGISPGFLIGLLLLYAGAIGIALAFADLQGASPWRVWCSVACMHWSYGLGFLTCLISGARWPFRAVAHSVPRLPSSEPA